MAEPKIIVVGACMAAVASKLAEIDGVTVDFVDDDERAVEAMRHHLRQEPVEAPEFPLRFDQLNNGHPRSYRKSR